MPDPVSMVELRMYSLFSSNNQRLIDTMPYKLKEYCSQLPKVNEKVLTINRQSLEVIMRQNTGRMGGRDMLECFCDDRGYHEHFGDHIQVVVAACIHNQTKVVFECLTTTPDQISTFHEGMLTYPQGHVNFDSTIAKTKHDNGLYDMTSFMHKAKVDMLREIGEEIGFEDEFTNTRFLQDVGKKLYDACPCYPIYIPFPGSMTRHVCILFDIDLTGTLFDEVCDEITTFEPNKHTARCLDYEALCRVKTLDDIDGWVMDSFSKLSFFRDTFIKKYIAQCMAH